MVEQVLAQQVTIAAIIIGTVIRTFIPFGLKVRAEIDLAEKEGRDPKVPKFHWIWGLAALFNIALIGIPMLATVDDYASKVINATSVWSGFFTILAIAIAVQELINRTMDTGIRVTTDKPAPS